MLPRNSHVHTCTSDTIIPTLPVFNIFLKLCEQISPCHLEVPLPTCLSSEMAETLFRAKESASLAPACPEQTTGMLFLNPQFRAHLHLQRDFTFSISLLQQAKCLPNGELYFPGGIHKQTIQLCFVPGKLSGCPQGYWSAATTATIPSQGSPGVGAAHATLPGSKWPCGRETSLRSASSPFLMLFLFRGLLLKMCQQMYVSTALLFLSHLQNHQHTSNSKTSSPLPLGTVPPHTLFLSQVFAFTQNRSLRRNLPL